MGKVKSIGIIAEDISDYESSKILIKRIVGKDNLGFHSRIGNGCGKIKRKALDWASDLKNRGCNMLILLHDLDNNKLQELERDLQQKMKGCAILNHFICIPVEEIEAWFLSDPNGIKQALSLKRIPNIKTKPESMNSPKEKLGEFIYSCSGKEKIYINTHHNQIIASKVSISLMRKNCMSFEKLHCFLLKQRY